MKKALLINLGILTIFVVISCKPKAELIKPCVIPYSEVKEAPLFLYNLPATTLCIEVKVKQSQNFKGPYSDFAKTYLGLDEESIVKRNSIYFKVTDISFSQFPSPDSSQWYAYMNDPTIIPSFSLTHGNILSGFNEVNINAVNTFYPEIFNPKQEEIDRFFYDLGIVKIENEEIQTVYRHVKRDSTIIKVPVQETVKRKMSTDEMARQAAEFISRIKNQRYELVAGLYEAFPEGKSLEASIKEMYDVENRYLSLFTGVNTDTTYTYKFIYTPQANSITPIIKTLCYFDSEMGLTPITSSQQYANNNINQQLRLEIEYTNYHPLVSQRISSGGPVYRIPAICTVKILHGEKTITTTHLEINQLGNIFQLPVDVLNKNSYKIEIDSKTGNLKSIISNTLYDVQKKNKKDR